MPGVSCIFYKTAFVQESLIRSLVTCWGCFPFNALGFSPRQCQRRESEAHFHTHTCLSFPHCTCIKTQKSQNINSATGFNSAQIQTAMHQHTLTQPQIHTLVVLSLLLVLTAHQSPVSACCNMLTPAISLKSLSIRSSCAGPSTLCKRRVRNSPTYTHA